MINNDKIEKLIKSEFLKLKEENVMFITNPGRMGDEDGSNFIVKEGENYKLYRVDGWMYGNDLDSSDYVSSKDVDFLFPQWYAAHAEDFQVIRVGNLPCKITPKYVYMYLGFGNTLCIDKSIYNEFAKYLKEEIEIFKKNPNHKNYEIMGIIYNVWLDAFLKLLKDKNKKLLNYESE